MQGESENKLNKVAKLVRDVLVMQILTVHLFLKIYM